MAATQAAKDAHRIMRRGTRACRECRRRKIRCIYDDGRNDICQECVLHERECVKQGLVRGSGTHGSASNVKVQVTRLESAVEKLAREKTNSSERNHSTTQDPLDNETIDSTFMEEEWKKHCPIYSLFNNEIITQDATAPIHGPDMANQVQFLDVNLCDKAKLLSTIEHIPSVLQALDFASDWWVSWREQHFALRKAAASLTLREFVQRKLKQENVVEVALGLLAIAMALGQLRTGIDDTVINLPIPAGQVMSHILAAVDQVVCDSERYKTDSEVIILLMMRAKHHTENNQLRKTWLRIRQAIRSAQAIGYGMANSLNGAISEEEAEKQRFVASIFEVDHIVSMVLGLPYAKDPAFTDARAFSVLVNTAIRDEELRMRALRRVISIVAGRINDRNAAGDINDYVTGSIQATLDMAANCMPSGWWNLLSQPLSGIARHRYESILVQTWFWVVQSYLHMPYVIKPSRNPELQRYRHLGLEAARNLMRSFNYLRMEPAISVYLCNCDDFQALLGACILLVGVLQNLSEDLISPTESSEDGLYYRSGDTSIEADLALVEDLKDIFRYRMTGQGGGISKQGLAVLEELTSLLYEDDEEHVNNTSFKGDVLAFGIDLSKRQKTIMLPYFGTIKIELTRKLPRRRPQEFPQHMVLTPPRSVDDSFSESSPSEFAAMEASPTYTPDQVPNFHNLPQSSMLPMPFTTETFTNNEPLSFANMGSIDDAVGNMQMPSISWDQWENFMFDQELEKDWNPGYQWNNDAMLYS